MSSEPWLTTSMTPKNEITMPPHAMSDSRSRRNTAAKSAVIAGVVAEISVTFVTTVVLMPVNCSTQSRNMPKSPMPMTPTHTIGAFGRHSCSWRHAIKEKRIALAST